ncbi:hypothetical protein DFH28DRAFT_904305 [Melampsora americana]|nr:hypothetical protein DFH28DRAFT_904305 [Melampsora americana]
MDQINPHHSGPPALTHMASQAQAQASRAQVTQLPLNQTDFHPTRFLQQDQNQSHGHHIPLVQQHSGQLNQRQHQQSGLNILPLSHNNSWNYHNPSAGLTAHGQQNQHHQSSTYPPGLTSHNQQIRDQQSNSLRFQNSEYNEDNHIASPANNPRVASVLALESHPSVIQNPPNHASLNHSTCPDIHPPRASQKRNNGRRCQETLASVPHSTVTAVPTSTSTPTSTQTQAPTTTRAIVNLFLPNSLIGDREPLQNSSSNLPLPEEMMKKSSVELRTLASKHAKGTTVPPSKQSLFTRLYEEFDKVLAINCINSEVSVSAVQKLWGQKGSRKGAHKYQRYTQSEEVRALYKDAAGVASGTASTLASIKWHAKSKTEQDFYKVENQTVNSATSDNTISSVPHADANDFPTKNKSLASARAAVNKFLIKWQTEANDMAATYSGDFAMIGVSNYLGDDAYQIVRATPRALKWVEHDLICNPKNPIAARLQAFVTGTEAGLLNLSKVKVDERAKCREALSDLISLRTKGTTKKWPWKGCMEKLAAEGYFVQFAPDSKSQASNIMQESNQLTPTQARDVLADLADNKILILETETGPVRKAKRKRPHGDTPPATSSTDQIPPAEVTPITNDSPFADHSTTNHTPAQDVPIAGIIPPLIADNM